MRSRLGRIRCGALTAAIAAIAVSGCSAATAAPAAQPATAAPAAPAATAAPGKSPSSGAAAYWDKSRLLGAQPWRDADEREIPVPGQTPNARTAPAALRVGALFEQDASGGHFCTASVVDSPAGDLLITAAHCLNSGNGGGYKTNIVFIPGYRDGTAPYGIWAPERLLVAPQWAASADPDLDVGFVILQPHDGENIEQLLGANQLGFDAGYQDLVRVTGYPNSADAPITCVNWTSEQSATQLRFNCGGYTVGTSGSPWVTSFDPKSRTGTVVGVIGGYQEGGDTPSVSYSVYFGSAVKQLYQEAVAEGTGQG